MEEWKPISGYEGYYEVSNTGIVKSVERKITRSDGVVQVRSSKVIAQNKDGDGYMTVHLCKSGVDKRVGVHRLVAIEFVDGYSPELEVDHIDADRTNNNYSNLEWVAHKENINRTISRGSHICTKDITGENNPNYGNHTLREKYSSNPELSKQKQSRPGLQNGRATKIIMTDVNGVEIQFQMIKECSEYLIDKKYTSSVNVDNISSSISAAIKKGCKYLNHFYRYA